MAVKLTIDWNSNEAGAVIRNLSRDEEKALIRAKAAVPYEDAVTPWSDPAKEDTADAAPTAQAVNAAPDVDERAELASQILALTGSRPHPNTGLPRLREMLAAAEQQAGE